MKIISALGGGGSSFVLRTLERKNCKHVYRGYDPYQIKIRLEKQPLLIGLYNSLLRLFGAYLSLLKILMRPDAFWTDWQFHKTGAHNPCTHHYQQELQNQKAYIIKTKHLRSGGIKISESDIIDNSLRSLVQSYIEKMQWVERDNSFTIVLISGHWGEYGVFNDLGLETIYLIRDLYNSLISHSKETRHQKD